MGLSRVKIGRPFLYAALLAFCVVAIFPFLWMLSTSLKDQLEVYQVTPHLVPQAWRWQNYREVLTYIPFGRMYLNTVFVSFCRTFGEVAFAAMGGYAFARISFRGRGFLFVAILAVLMIPGQVTLVPNYILEKYLGWLNTYQGLIIPRIYSALGMFLFRQFFMTLPSELTDAAKIDGCNPFLTFWFVALPLTQSALMAFGVLSLLYAWNDFLWPLIISTSMDMNVISVGVTFFQNQSVTNFALTMAAATLAVLPMMIVFALAQRYIIQGITMTGFK